MSILTTEVARVVTGFHQVTDLSSAISCPGAGAVLLLQAEAQNIRYRLDGIDPTSTVGHLLLANASVTINMGEAGSTPIKVIEATGGAILNVTSFR